MDTDKELEIVEELRFFAEAADTEALVVTMLSGRTFADAADEIERLRSESIGMITPIGDDSDGNSQDSSVNVNDHADPPKCLHTRCEDLTLAKESEIKHLRSMVVYWCNAEERMDGRPCDYYENAAYALDKLRKLVER
jgi:hypothetical protein